MAKDEGRMHSMEGFAKRFEEWTEEMERMCSIQDNCIVFNVWSEYDIALDRCDTPIKILKWVAHLSEKTWMTTALIERFIILATGHHKIDIYTGA